MAKLKLELVTKREHMLFRTGNHNRLSNDFSDYFIEQAPQWTVHERIAPFSRRTTCIDWHPTYMDVLAVSSHGGDIYVWNLHDKLKEIMHQGQGPGGSITEMKFHPCMPNSIYATSVNGTFCLYDLEGRHSQVFLDTLDWRFWYCTLSISQSHHFMFAGTSYGDGTLLDKHGAKICTHKFHKNKIQHAEFAPYCEELLITASNDRTIKLWDIRTISSNKLQPLTTFQTPAVTNSAYFDPYYGSTLLVTCQNSQLLLYNINTMSSEPICVINHPHKFFQHLTPIKATWHPFYSNILICGRYSGKDGDRSVDIIDWVKGETVAKFKDPLATGIVSINEFNKHGDKLASGMGSKTLVWKQNELQRGLIEADTVAAPLTKTMKRTGSSHQRTQNSKKKEQLRSKDLKLICQRYKFSKMKRN